MTRATLGLGLRDVVSMTSVHVAQVVPHRCAVVGTGSRCRCNMPVSQWGQNNRHAVGMGKPRLHSKGPPPANRLLPACLPGCDRVGPLCWLRREQCRVERKANVRQQHAAFPCRVCRGALSVCVHLVCGSANCRTHTSCVCVERSSPSQGFMSTLACMKRPAACRDMQAEPESPRPLPSDRHPCMYTHATSTCLRRWPSSGCAASWTHSLHPRRPLVPLRATSRVAPLYAASTRLAVPVSQSLSRHTRRSMGEGAGGSTASDPPAPQHTGAAAGALLNQCMLSVGW